MTDPVDDFPELATNAEWRGIMQRARKDHGYSQETFAKMLSVSQPLISKIESGETAASKLVIPICQMLSIPLPEHFVDEAERAWVQLGRLLRSRNPVQAKLALELVESMVKQLEPEPTTQPADPAKPERK